MALSPDRLVDLWGQPIGHRPGALPGLERVSTDSRADLTGALFVPLVGDRFDGHAFLTDALSGGHRRPAAAAAVAQRDRLPVGEAEALARSSGRPIWLVEDTLAAYQQLGRLWRRQLGAPVVAVTGSAGKTTTRELIRAALAPLGTVVASVGNENNDVGAPLTLLKAGAGTAALVVEMGMRGPGEIERLSLCAEPDVAVITNIGTAHIGRLGSREAIGGAKCEITAALRPDGLVVIPAGDPLLEAALAAVWSGRVLRVALVDERDGFPADCPPADLLGRLDGEGPGSITPSGGPCGNGTLTLSSSPALPGSFQELVVELPLPGRHNARNLLLALAVARELGVPADALRRLAVELPGGRSRRIEIAGVHVLDETYNASPEAVLAALDLVASQPGRRFAVLGTMLELGDRSLDLHRRVARRAAELGLDGLVIVDGGREGMAMEEAGSTLPRLVRVATPIEAAPALLDWLRPGDRLLLKASRGVALETLLPQLEAGLPRV